VLLVAVELVAVFDAAFVGVIEFDVELLVEFVPVTPLRDLM
jgi:hypothetical protein